MSSNARDFELPRRLIVAISSRAIDPADGIGTPQELKARAAATAAAMLPLLLLDNQLIITHGNGSQVGKLLLASAIARERITPQSLDILVAQTQGGTAYMLSQAFENALRAVGSPRHVVGLVTQVEVDPKDPAFGNPTKPVGPVFSKAEAEVLARDYGITMKEDSARDGWRYVVPSPSPVHVCDISLAEALMCMNTVVVAGGGGGIPVVRDAIGCRRGIDAVIDKDLTTAMMGSVLGIPDMLILTGVPNVALDYGRPTQRELARVSLSQVRHWHSEGQFLHGMGPKIDAAIRFLEAGGRRAIITSLDAALPALHGVTGTHIVPDDVSCESSLARAGDRFR